MAILHYLAIPGSLRAHSSNRALLEAMQAFAPDGVSVTIYEDLSKLPHFNPDLDGDRPPEQVRRFRNLVSSADALLISSPEYAHGIPGSLKNALDWLVACPEFPGKRVALINSSPRSTFVQAALREVLATMSACIVKEACVTIPLGGRGAEVQSILAESATRTILGKALEAISADLLRVKKQS